MERTAANAWERQLRKSLHTLERLHQNIPRESAEKVDKILIDNFYLFEKEGRSARRALPRDAVLKSGTSGLPYAYEALSAFAKSSESFDFSTLAEACCNAQFDFTELTLTELLLKSALLELASNAAQTGDAVCLQQAAEHLQACADLPFEDLFAVCSETERLLETDGGFACADRRTKALYRRLLCRFAQKQSVPEAAAAKSLLETAKQGEYTLFSLLSETHRRRGRAMLITEAMLSAAVAAGFAWGLGAAWSAPLFWLPLWAVFQSGINALFLKGIPPAELPAADLNGEIPASAATVITVSSLLPTGAALREMQSHLRDLYLRAGQGAVTVCLLADLKAAKSETRPEDGAALARAAEMIDALNAEFPHVFSLYVRGRVWSETQQEFTGFERKRGAITAFLRALRGDASAFSLCHGETAALENAKYILALDSDTELSFDCLYALLCVAEHPENTPKIDAAQGKVTAGYGVLAPRAGTALSSAYATRFARWMTGTGGISGYDDRIGERYQDLFGEGLFTGKGLIHVDTYNALIPDAFESETVLSHDIPEGELLRTAFVSDVQITDGFPKTARAYFARMGRWVRGDAQNAALLGKSVKTAHGDGKNPFSALSKYKLFDNLRRAATPAAAWTLCLLSVFLKPLPAAVCLAAAVLAVSAPSLFSLLRLLTFGGTAGLSARYAGKAVPEAIHLLSDAVLSVVLLPRTAAVCLVSLWTGLVRRFITHKNMLSWVTAAQSERAGTAGSAVLYALPAVLSALWLFLIGGSFARLLAVLFLFEPIFSKLSERPYPQKRNMIGARELDTLRSHAAAMWRYFAEHCNAENSFLPPDNVQESPVPRVAHRTSPTNIGLMLCACLAARDLSLIDTKELDERLLHTLESVHKLQKWHGNLLNWYDTVSLAPLSPRYASAVDSGNFLCCLAALKEGLAEYPSQSPARVRICELLETLLRGADLSALYDPRRRLFYIGYDLEKQEFTHAHYDLLMSESRMMSYYAVASRAVPKVHWGALSRVQEKNGGYAGALSWSGTMFEYFMPYLFLESRENTLAHESLRYCVYCQRKFAQKRGMPFGISESGYYRFDEQLNYQYRAHGVPRAALRQSPFDEAVVSPYSTFLCLPFVPRAALQNLKRLEALDCMGEYGFYEAIDFTNGMEPQIVRSFMAHHVGMSLLAIDNALFDRAMQRRFLRNAAMCAGSPLLEEPVPTAPVYFKKKEKELLPARAEKPKPSMFAAESPSLLQPRAGIYSNGAWTTVLADCGAGHALYGGVNVTRQSRDLIGAPQGVFAVFQSEAGALPLCRVLDRENRAVHSALFAEHQAVFTAQAQELTATAEVALHARLPAEFRRFTIYNHGKKTLRGRLLVYLEPSLCTPRAEDAHKAFQKLFVTAETAESGQTAVFERRTRETETPLFLGCGFLERQPFSLKLMREAVLQRGEGVFSLLHAGFPGQQDAVGAADTCFAASVSVEIPPKGQKSVTLFLCCAGTKPTLLERTARLRQEGYPSESGLRLLAKQPEGQKELQTVMPALFFSASLSAAHARALCQNKLDRTALWRFGISGDRPIVLLETAENAAFSEISPYLQVFSALRTAGLACDFVFLLACHNDAAKMLEQKTNAALLRENLPDRTTVGSVFFLRKKDLAKEELTALQAFSTVLLPQEQTYVCADFHPVPIDTAGTQKTQNTATQTGFQIADKPALPWCYILANPSFSTLLGDSTLGASFAVNSRLNKLTRFSNDAMLDNTGERLFVRKSGKIFDLLRGASVEFGAEQAVYSAKIDDILATVTVTVPERGMLKNMEIELQNKGANEQALELCFYTEPALNENGTATPFLQSDFDGDALEIRNPTNTAVKGVLRVGTDKGKEAFYTVSKTDFYEGSWQSGGQMPNAAPCAALGRTLVLPPKRQDRIRFYLSFGRTRKSARTVAALSLPQTQDRDRIELSSPDAPLNAIYNHFLVNQIKRGRIFARTGFYQSGGAYGFRDQLQDVAALLLTEPALCRRQIFRCCAAQFEAGDVLHWWHPVPERGGKTKGVRTRYSDDLLWLPDTLARYVLATGDCSVLTMPIPYLAAEELSDTEAERYFDAPRTNVCEPVLQHAVRAIRRALRFGAHGLLLMGAGDWNDSFNTVGAKGRGESVWLSQFAVIVLERFAQMLDKLQQTKEAEEYRKTAENLRQAIEENAWTGDRYLRAFYDDGTPMGTADSEECRIDSLTQSFSVFAGLSKERARQALQTAYRELVDTENGVVKLFAPAFSGKDKKAGYVAAYPAGIRENGGQYTHAAVWFCRALFEAGLETEAQTVLSMLNPMQKYESPEIAEKYKTEPYYLAGDVYSAAGAQGHGGWSLYTGSAGHLYALVTEVFLGVRQKDGRLYFDPHPPESWGGFQYALHLAGAKISVHVCAKPKGELYVDGRRCDFLLPDGQNHVVKLL